MLKMLARRACVPAMQPVPLLVALALGVAAVLGPSTSPAALGAAAAPAREITGFLPYVLGAEIGMVLRADPELAAGNYPMWSHLLLTQRYGRSTVAALGGTNFIATVGLQFWRGRLAVVVVKWPAGTFDSASAWRRAAEDFHRLLAGAYASELIKKHTVASPSVWALDLVDAQGNELSAWSNDRPQEITVVYLWSPYARALESEPGNQY